MENKPYVVCEKCQGCKHEDCCFLALKCIPNNREYYESKEQR
jgi:hypothetical protein